MVSGANEMEDVMNFNLTRNDLATKSASQLAALFQQASNTIAVNQAATASAQSLLAMIRAEIAKRTPAS
jgi:phosphotransferase system HPr-like phosphotransfer protein